MKDNIFWTDILTINPGFEFKVAIVSDIPFSSQGSSAPELSEF